eukprot:6177037-Pleurochrysis_carterae.AAC.1
MRLWTLDRKERPWSLPNRKRVRNVRRHARNRPGETDRLPHKRAQEHQKSNVSRSLVIRQSVATAPSIPWRHRCRRRHQRAEKVDVGVFEHEGHIGVLDLDEPLVGNAAEAAEPAVAYQDEDALRCLRSEHKGAALVEIWE